VGAPSSPREKKSRADGPEKKKKRRGKRELLDVGAGHRAWLAREEKASPLISDQESADSPREKKEEARKRLKEGSSRRASRRGRSTIKNKGEKERGGGCHLQSKTLREKHCGRDA